LTSERIKPQISAGTNSHVQAIATGINPNELKKEKNKRHVNQYPEYTG